MKSKLDAQVCDIVIIHDDIVDMVKEQMPGQKIIQRLAEFFKVFGDATRLKILYAVSTADEMCVCDMAALLGMSPSAISHQLKALRQAKLVRYRKKGKAVYYSLDDDHIKQIFNQGMQHINE